MVEIKYYHGATWKNFTLLIGSSKILTKLFTSINAKQVNNKIIPNTRKIRCRNSSICSEKGNSNVTIELFVKLKLELVVI
jgi:hypothetical protein